EAEQAIDDLQGLRQGKLAIAASPTIGVYFLPDVLVHYRQRFPAIDVSVEIENAHILQQRVLDGDVDFAMSEVAPAHDQIVAEIFTRDRLIPVAASRHPLARKRSIAL